MRHHHDHPPRAVHQSLPRQVRSDGWSIVAEELGIGLLSVFVPVRDRSGQEVAAHINAELGHSSAKAGREGFY